MSPSTLVMIMLGMLVLMAWYANVNKRNKILCRFRRVNKTLIVKWVKMQSRYVVFDGGKYDIIPSRIIFQWYCAGLIHMFFPQWVATLDYTFASRWPHDPNKMEITAETPRTRKALNKEEWVESYYKGAKPSSSQKTRASLITQYLPWVAIILVVVVAVYFNNQMVSFGATLDAVIGKLNMMTPK